MRSFTVGGLLPPRNEVEIGLTRIKARHGMGSELGGTLLITEPPHEQSTCMPEILVYSCVMRFHLRETSRTFRADSVV